MISVDLDLIFSLAQAWISTRITNSGLIIYFIYMFFYYKCCVLLCCVFARGGIFDLINLTDLGDGDYQQVWCFDHTIP